MRLGIVGTGMIVKTALPLLKHCSWEPVAICSTPKSKTIGEELCAEYGMEKAYCDLAQMLQETEMDAVYIAVPNHLHFAFTKQVLEAGKNVIVEKPMVGSWSEAQELSGLVEKHDLFLFEAITTMYLPNFNRIQELLPQIGNVRLAVCNFSQYSRHYDAFQQGELPPVFDSKKLGGALMDLNSYNLHYLLGLFGAPKGITYQANMERGVDTSGVLMLDYNGFQAVAIASKDCAAPASCLIQGTKGYLSQSTAANVCGTVTLHLNSGEETIYSNEPVHRMIPEFQTFAKEISSGHRDTCKRMLLHSVQVSKVLTAAHGQILTQLTTSC